LSDIKVTARADELILAPNGDKLGLYRQANESGLTLSQYLEQLDPSHGYNDGLDAFERQMRRFNILTKSIPSKGLWASKVERFYMADDAATTPILFPEFVNRVAREALVQDSILNEMVAIRTPIDSNAYRSIYITNDETKTTKKRVSQGADFPVAEMTTSENTIKIYKYGRRVKATYEAIRRMRIDLFALHIKAIMKQADVDRATDAYTVLKDGDGNTGTAATNYNKTALQTGLASAALTYSGWLSYMFKFYPYKMTHIIGPAASLVELLTVDAPNIDPLKLIQQLKFGNAGNGGEMAQNIFNDYRIVFLPDATANTLLGYDKQYALEQVTEIGSDLAESQRLIANQWEEIVISEVNGFAVFLPLSRRKLTLNA